jgi:hypothetical protein
MRMALVSLAALAGCNQILGNGNFAGPPADACTGTACPVDTASPMIDATPMIDASMACEQQSMPPTRILGHVFAPNGTLPLAGATVYVAQNAPDPLTTKPFCGCIPATGGAVISTTTAADGSFELKDAPSGTNVRLVIQMGEWRRQVVIPDVAMCADTNVAPAQTRLPKNRTEGDMPQIALTTGAADTLECELRQIGIDDSEIGTLGDARRVHLFAGFNGGATNAFMSGFAGGSGSFAAGPALLANLANYDHVLMSCEGTMPSITSADAQQLHDWANTGGQLLIEHYHRQWMTMSPEWNPIATFNDFNPPPDGVTVTIDQTFPRGHSLVLWLEAIGATTTGVVNVTGSRNSVATLDVAKNVSVWAHLDPNQTMGSSGDQIFSFPVPLGAANACGRVVFTDLHHNGPGPVGQPFPSECPAMPLAAQQDILAFLFFDDPTCTPTPP